jgi:Kdo2-lipid IVA lauroyltransferase/acyltransferase
LQNKIEYFFFISFSKLFCFLGLSISRKIAGLLGNLFYYCIPLRKKVVFKNISIAFAELTEPEKKQLVKNIYKSAAITIIEILSLPSLTKEELLGSVKYNSDFVHRYYEQGQGVVMMTAHFGNWEYGALATGLLSGAPVSVVSKNQRNPYVTDFMDRNRAKWGNKVVPLGVTIKEIYVELKKKNIVGLVADQRGPSDGPRVNFFGKPSAAYTGPAALAIKTGAPLLFGVMARQPDYSYVFQTVEVSKENLPQDREAAVLELCQRTSDKLEEAIKKYPSQWFWMHDRWKY